MLVLLFKSYLKILYIFINHNFPKILGFYILQRSTMFQKNSSYSRLKGKQRRFQRFLIKLVILSLVVSLLFNTITLYRSSKEPIGAFFVLGGSIRREIYAAQLAKQYPQIPILISQGSQVPCTWLIFERNQVSKENVYLEKCAHNTFTNFVYSVPILKQWGIKKVKLITSATHLPRAVWMANILIGSQGIWVELDLAQEKGIPGNNEHWLKTILDLTRSLIWAMVSQVIQPQCSDVIHLADLSREQLSKSSFKCERQGNLQ
jgi:uncharacterized SAM-binding protein YcdF (DUF218 family)